MMQVSVEALNRHLVCGLCDGYFRDAHTIQECLHTFCKPCLLMEFARLAKGAKSCPICLIGLGQNPESKCIFDRNLQSCVDKLFPEFLKRERGEGEDTINKRENYYFFLPSNF